MVTAPLVTCPARAPSVTQALPETLGGLARKLTTLNASNNKSVRAHHA